MVRCSKICGMQETIKQPRVDLGGPGSAKPSIMQFKKMRNYNTMTGPQNAGNPISEGLNVNNFLGEDDPGPSTGDRLRI